MAILVFEKIAGQDSQRRAVEHGFLLELRGVTLGFFLTQLVWGGAQELACLEFPVTVLLLV